MIRGLLVMLVLLLGCGPDGRSKCRESGGTVVERVNCHTVLTPIYTTTCNGKTCSLRLVTLVPSERCSWRCERPASEQR